MAAEKGVFAVGSSGTILFYDGTSWSSVSSPTGNQLNAIHGYSENRIMAVGNGGVILLYNGTSWSAMVSGTGSSFIDVSVIDGTYAVACTASTIRLANGALWGNYPNQPTYEYDLVSVWGAALTEVYVANSSSEETGSYTHKLNLVTYVEGWSGIPPLSEFNGLYGIGIGTANNFGIIKYADDNYQVATWEGNVVLFGGNKDITDIWAGSSSDVIGVGNSGGIVNWDGVTATEQNVGSEHLHGVWADGNGNAFAVGEGGTILFYDGSTWEEMTSGTSEDLYGVWGWGDLTPEEPTPPPSSTYTHNSIVLNADTTSDSLLPENKSHNLTADNVVLCYNTENDDSARVAAFYMESRGLELRNVLATGGYNSLGSSNLRASATRTSQNIILESDYITQIKNPIKAQLQALEDEYGPYYSGGWVIILGYDMPHAFYPNDDEYGSPIAIASDLHRIWHNDSSYQVANPLYDRKGGFQFFGQTDAQSCLITAVIDAPTYPQALALIQRATDVSNQQFVAGKIFVDPYGLDDTAAQQAYEDDILDFVENELDNLGLESWQTERNYFTGDDPTVHQFVSDSFYWGWFRPRFSSQLFANQNERRVFLYNADEDSASDIADPLSDQGSDPWCNLAVQVEPGYASCAGAFDAPGEEAYLRPKPFFETLHQGATLGEAFLFASPYVKWQIILIGDPYMTVNFPAALPDSQDPDYESLTNAQGAEAVLEQIEIALAYVYRSSVHAGNLSQYVAESDDTSETLALITPTYNFSEARTMESMNRVLFPVLHDFIRFIRQTEGQTLSNWLTDNSIKTTELVSDLFALDPGTDTLSSSLINDEGYWKFTFLYERDAEEFAWFHFEIEVATDADFTNVLIQASSYTDESGWQYENEYQAYVDLASTGLSSNYSGRYVRYRAESENYLARGEIYYVRWRVLDFNGNPYSVWNEASDVMIVTS